jgi:hypothetical protein
MYLLRGGREMTIYGIYFFWFFNNRGIYFFWYLLFWNGGSSMYLLRGGREMTIYGIYFFWFFNTPRSSRSPSTSLSLTSIVRLTTTKDMISDEDSPWILTH